MCAGVPAVLESKRVRGGDGVLAPRARERVHTVDACREESLAWSGSRARSGERARDLVRASVALPKVSSEKC